MEHPVLVVMVVLVLIFAVVLLVVFGWATWVEAEEQRVREMNLQRFYREGLRAQQRREDSRAR